MREANIRHGYCIRINGKGNRLYNIWCSMKQRCYDTNRKDYHSYGGRGIRVCDDWLNDFVSFKDWALSHGYSNLLTLDRIDNNGDYCPENCRWATRREQDHNRPGVVLVYYNKEEYTVNELAKCLNINAQALMRRIKAGYGSEEAVADTIAHQRKR